MTPQSKAPSKLVVIDGANALYRAFFAIPPLRSPGGVPTNAALGFVNYWVLRSARLQGPQPPTS